MITVLYGKLHVGNSHVQVEERDSSSVVPRRKSLIHQKMILGAMLGLQVLSVCGATSWQDWLKERVGRIKPDQADEIVGMLAALEQEHRIVLAKEDPLCFDSKAEDVTTDSGVSDFAKKVGARVGSVFGAISIEYASINAHVKAECNEHAGALKIVVHEKFKNDPAVVKMCICNVLSGLSVNRNMIGVDKPKTWHRRLDEVSAICHGFGEILMNSTKAEKSTVGNKTTMSYSCSSSLSPVEIAWTVNVVAQMRGVKQAKYSGRELQVLAWCRGGASARANETRTRRMFQSFLAAHDEGKTPKIPDSTPAWVEGNSDSLEDVIFFGKGIEVSKIDRPEFKPIKIPELEPITPIGLQPSSLKVVPRPKIRRFDEDKFPEYVQPSVEDTIKYWQQKIQELPHSPVPDVNEFKKTVPLANKLINENHLKCGRHFVQASKSELDPFVRFVLSRKAIAVCIKENEWDLVTGLLDFLAEIDGIDFALEVIRPKRPQIKVYASKAQSVLMKINELEKMRRFFRNRRRSHDKQKILVGSNEDADLHAEAALYYMMLGSITNAHAELVMSNPSWDRIMRETEGEWFKRPKTFIWEAPKPEITVADFWRKYGADKQGRAKAYCDTVSREWYGKVLKISNEWVDDQLNPLFWRWRMAKRINGETSANDSKWNARKGDGSFDTYSINACGLRFPAENWQISREKIVQVETDSEVGVERAYRPASFWLKSCEPVVLREYDTRILIIPMNVMPLRDEDFDSAGNDFPSEKRLRFKLERSEKVSYVNYKKWIAFYYGCKQSEVVLTLEKNTDCVSVSLVEITGMPAIGAFVEVKESGKTSASTTKRVFVDFQPIDGRRLSVENIKKILQFIGCSLGKRRMI